MCFLVACVMCRKMTLFGQATRSLQVVDCSFRKHLCSYTYSLFAMLSLSEFFSLADAVLVVSTPIDSMLEESLTQSTISSLLSIATTGSFPVVFLSFSDSSVAFSFPDSSSVSLSDSSSVSVPFSSSVSDSFSSSVSVSFSNSSSISESPVALPLSDTSSISSTSFSDSTS